MTSPCYCTLLRTATRKVAAAYDAALAPVGINIAQYALLRMIQNRQQVSLTELGRVADLDRSTIGRNVKVLERDGLVKTARGEDQREAVVSLAPGGIEALAAATPLWEACQRQIEKRLGADKIEALRAIANAV
ncbi:MarR family winged helix-turn-helix transcriptional regulator [Xanthobacter versatilis]|uniref:Transcriptional regulator, MarR family n=1 Tax=Xanthobacter autotrophicus (strain ATCC BAA-1158 / Py2) TaxID=78245 RepID=A7IEV3_XANP2|nr:transcriptional regulator, MarR family [Xanthobacter autotrophicus Py2]